MDIFNGAIIYEKTSALPLECSVCGNPTVCLPYLRCKARHAICNPCYSKQRVCKICNPSRRYFRDINLENLYMRTCIPCVNTVRGCMEQDCGINIKLHEVKCIFMQIPCPFKMTLECNDFLPAVDLEEHCWQKHPFNFYEHSIVNLRCKNFMVSSAKGSVAVIQTYGEIFRLYWRYSRTRDHVFWFLSYHNKSLHFRRFTYEISFPFSRPYLKTEEMVAEDFRTFVPAAKMAGLSTAQLKSCCDKKGDLSFIIIIKDNRGKPYNKKLDRGIL